MIEFQRIVSVQNPCASNTTRAARYYAELCEAYPQFHDRSLRPIMTTPDRGQTIERIQKHTREGDLLFVQAGDSGYGVTAEAIAGQKDIIMLPGWGGNGNDAARDLNGDPDARPIRDIIEQGEAVAIHPLAITIDALKQQALNYYEIGANPKGAKLLNTKLWRNLPGYGNDWLRSMYEYAALPPAAFFSRRFSITEDGVTRRAVNLSAVRSRYAAKHAKFPVSLAEPHAFMTESATPFHLLPWAVRAVRGTLKGNYLELGETRTMRIGRTVLYHIDAEPGVIEKGSTVELAMSAEPSMAVSTRHLALAA